jgi:uncharacterized protein (UPF0254 family)
MWAEKINDADVAAEIHNLTKAYLDGKDYFIDKLAEAVSIVAAAFTLKMSLCAWVILKVMSMPTS